jgi:hypothetical protein
MAERGLDAQENQLLDKLELLFYAPSVPRLFHPYTGEVVLVRSMSGWNRPLPFPFFPDYHSLFP